MSTETVQEPKAPKAKAASLSSAALDKSAMDTGQILNLQPKKVIRLRKAGKGEQQFAECWVNGYKFEIARGVEVEVPQTVHDLLAEAGEI